MRKTLLLGMGSVATVVLAGAAQAADLPRKAPPPVAAPAYVTWTGCYLGAHVGAGWGTKSWRDDEGFVEADYTLNGLLGGGQVGCDYQFAHRVVVGVEGSFSGTNIKGDSEHDPVDHSKINWIATATARIGFTADSALIYVKGGAAWLRERHTFDNCDGFCTVGQSRTGWLFGTGIEYAISPGWSAKVEYNYMDFGSKNVVDIRDCSCDPDIFRVKQQIHAIKFGVNYRFWGGPITARY